MTCLGFVMNGDEITFKAILETRGRKTEKTHRVELLVVRYNEKLYFSRRNANSDWLKNAIENPSVRVEIGDESFTGKAALVRDDLLCKKISQLKYDDEKRASEPRVVLEVSFD